MEEGVSGIGEVLGGLRTVAVEEQKRRDGGEARGECRARVRRLWIPGGVQSIVRPLVASRLRLTGNVIFDEAS